MPPSRPYVGVNGTSREVFRSSTTPTNQSHGDLYKAVIGPFKTVRAANYMAKFGGANNPHLRTVQDAERIAREHDQDNRFFRRKYGH